MEVESLLHPAVHRAAWRLLQDGHLRDSVLNAIVATFDLIRDRSGLTQDGVDLVNRVFSEREPHLLVGDLTTESGRNAQLGAMQLARGLYQGIRSPAVHTVSAEFDAPQAARLLVTASALAYIVDRAQPANTLRFDGVYVALREETKPDFLRFFQDGWVVKALVTTAEPMREGWIPDWLTRDWAEWQDAHRAKFNLQSNWVRFTVPVQSGGEHAYEGQIGPLSLKVRWNTTSGQKGSRQYTFTPFARKAV